MWSGLDKYKSYIWYSIWNPEWFSSSDDHNLMVSKYTFSRKTKAQNIVPTSTYIYWKFWLLVALIKCDYIHHFFFSFLGDLGT